jgi:hypothetical protein
MEILNRNARQKMTTRNRVLLFAFLCAVSILFWWHSLVMTLRLALANDAYTHILLILPLGVALIYLDSKHPDSKHDSRYGDSKALRIDPEPSPRIGAALLLLALLIVVMRGGAWLPQSTMSGCRSACLPS